MGNFFRRLGRALLSLGRRVAADNIDRGVEVARREAARLVSAAGQRARDEARERGLSGALVDAAVAAAEREAKRRGDELIAKAEREARERLGR